MRTYLRITIPGSILAAASALAIGCGGDSGGDGSRASLDPFELSAEGTLVARQVDENMGPRRSDPGASAATMRRFADCEELERYRKKQGGGQGVGRLELFSGPAVALESATADSGARASAAGGVDATGSNSAGTNVQEAGIDEGDWVKVYGSEILVSSQGKLRAVSTGGGAPQLADELDLPKRFGKTRIDDFEAKLLISGDTAVVMRSGWRNSKLGGPQTVLHQIDISNPTDLTLERTLVLDGSPVDSRQHGETVRLATSSFGGGGPVPLPEAAIFNGDGEREAKGPLSACSDVLRPIEPSGPSTLTVVTMDLSQGIEPIDTDSVMTDGQIVYASDDSMYIATSGFGGFGGFRGGPAIDIAIAPSNGRTEIHRFDISDPKATSYAASGRVPGSMLSQWAMSERDGYLRVATTLGEFGRDSRSRLTVLEQQGPALVKVSSVGGLGRGERIFSVRFFDDVGFVVTFRQTDPLYAIDLSDPLDPRVRGELKIKGYSAYLHPVGEDLILGVGQDADLRGRTKGVQASLFDVRDLDDPQLIDKTTFGKDSYSSLEFDGKAFSFDPDSGLAIFPISAWMRDGFDPDRTGAVALPIGTGGATGQDGVIGSFGEPTVLRSPAMGESAGGGSSGVSEIEEAILPVEPPIVEADHLTRSVIVSGRVYSLSPRVVVAHDLPGLNPQGELFFERR